MRGLLYFFITAPDVRPITSEHPAEQARSPPITRSLYGCPLAALIPGCPRITSASRRTCYGKSTTSLPRPGGQRENRRYQIPKQERRRPAFFPSPPSGRGLFAMTCARRRMPCQTHVGARKSSGEQGEGDTNARRKHPHPSRLRICSGHSTADIDLDCRRDLSRPSQIQGAKPSPSRERGKVGDASAQSGTVVRRAAKETT